MVQGKEASKQKRNEMSDTAAKRVSVEEKNGELVSSDSAGLNHRVLSYEAPAEQDSKDISRAGAPTELKNGGGKAKHAAHEESPDAAVILRQLPLMNTAPVPTLNLKDSNMLVVSSNKQLPKGPDGNPQIFIPD
ncbi:hypothetical protein HDU96_003578 [Phlyctochytrium bullatum]|nr:hypothetical protein HDU96_003578 [Phlyctochytrium bullatum]